MQRGVWGSAVKGVSASGDDCGVCCDAICGVSCDG